MDDAASALLTDLYQLNMIEAYLARGMTGTAVFEFFVRKLPDERNFLVAAGLEQALDYLESLRFTPEDLAWLSGTGRFTARLVDYLSELRFTGDVHAMPEGTVFFPNEPILRIAAPLPEAQLVETRLINLLHFQTLIASKAARMVLAAGGRHLVDFGLRRAHGAEAGLLAARASYIAGFDGTATVLAERAFGIPTFGTMAHSFVEAHDSEIGAFQDFARARPDNLTFLIDTYDSEAAVRNVVALAPRLKAEGIVVRGVRIDSGDLAALSRRVRTILDDGGLSEVTILASGGLDEESIAVLVRSGAPIDGFGVGTGLTTSSDRPALDCAYKLQEYAGIPRRKHSPGKATWPGRKQVFRRRDGDGRLSGDSLTTEDDAQPGTPLIVPAMARGRRLALSPSLAEIRARARSEIESLPEPLRRLDGVPPYPVTASARLRQIAEETDRRLAESARAP
jgi:nicotinate phosphoribosyltransferase